MYNIYCDDVMSWCKTYQGNKFHALLCDPPYHLVSPSSKSGTQPKNGLFSRLDGGNKGMTKGFMGKEWDGGDIAFNPEMWFALSEHLYPGAFGMAFASSRGWHRLAVAIEDAGMVIHPSIFGWCYGSGFPKATRIDTQIDKSAGVEQEIIGKRTDGRYKYGFTEQAKRAMGDIAHAERQGFTGEMGIIKQPAAPLARAWSGHRYGLQALKPALEPIIVFQKPYEGRPVDCITKTGAGALWIDRSRIPTNLSIDDKRLGGNGSWKTDKAAQNVYEGGYAGNNIESSPLGRWPANFYLDAEAAKRFDEQSGERKTTWISMEHQNNRSNEFLGELGHPGLQGYNDTGGASRFFFQVAERIDDADPVRYVAKASRTERDKGLTDHCIHPTMKPIALSKYLSTLLLPPPEYSPRRLLVPFSGVSSEMIGAYQSGWEEVIGIEKEQEYCDLAKERMFYWCSI